MFSTSRRLLIILGSTSTGKTDLALNLAKKFNGELISCDSRQVYCGLDIGTGKMPGGDLRFKIKDLRIKKGRGYWEIEGIKIWMYDVVDPRRQYTVADFVRDARKMIGDIRERGKLPIVVGGTGLYLKALLEGLPNLAIPLDKNLRKKLEKLSKEKLQEKLQKTSPDRWESLNESDRQNPRRLVRAIEIATSLVSLAPRNDNERACDDNVLKIGLTAPRHILYQKIDERVVDRINQGMIDEAEKLHKEGLSFKRMRQLGLEYGVLADYLEGKITSKNELVKILQGKIHGFARHQITWFKKPCLPAGREKDVAWFDIMGKNFPSDVEKMITKWYHQPADVTKD